MSTNASPEYAHAEKRYSNAKTMEEKIAALEEMIRYVPSHKGGEAMRADLRTRMKKMLEKQEKAKKTGKSTQKTIKKEGFQCVLLGLPNSGKSTLLTKLTNAKPQISPNPFTTKTPEVGSMDYYGVKAQIIDLPSIGSENFDSGIVNTADCIIIVLNNVEDLEKVMLFTKKSYGKMIITINKSDFLSDEQLRKLTEKLRSKKIPAIIISAQDNTNINLLKEKIFDSMSCIRVYTKEPGKEPSKIPIVVKEKSSVHVVAEKILKGFSRKVKETKITGPSSKFPKQKVGLSHVLKDRDIIEFKTN